MQLLLLLFLMLACLPERWEPVYWIGSPARSAALTWLSIAAVVGAAAVIAQRVCGQLGVLGLSRDLVLARYGRLRFLHLLLLCVVYVVTVFAFGWGATVQHFFHTTEWYHDLIDDTFLAPGAEAAFGPGVEAVLQQGWRYALAPGAELFVLAPFVLGLLGSWASFYDAERAIHVNVASAALREQYWGRGAYVSFHFRQNLAMVFIPVLLLLVEKGLRRLLPDGGTLAGAAVGVGGALVVFAAMPWLLRLVLGLKPLPDGPLRQRLLAAARRLHFRCNDVLLWQTRGNVANAMVAGVLPVLRYVLLTDRLASDLSPEEVEAVFGHEVGHVRHHHMLYYVGFLMVSMAVVWAGVVISLTELVAWLPDVEAALEGSAWQDLALVPPIVLLGTYIFLVFGFLSRRCERQADIYGCRAVSCLNFQCAGHESGVAVAPSGRGLCTTGITIFINALEKVAQLNGISRDRPGWLQSWQHSTIGRRVEFLERVREDSAVEGHFQRRVVLIKWALFLGLGCLLALLGTTFGWDRLLSQGF
jgi:Zn-dependent protease with chaperone function